MDVRAIPARNAFDLVGAYDVLEHLVEDQAVMREVHAALVPGGGFIATVPQHPWLWSNVDDISCHVRRYRRGELESKLRSAGFEVIFSSSYGVTLPPLMLASRLVSAQRAIAQQFDPPAAANAALRLALNAEVALTLKGVVWPIGGSRVAVARKAA